MNEKESRLDNVEHRRLFEQKILDDAALETKTSFEHPKACLLYTSPSPRDQRGSRMPSSA